jgi:spore maturation protein CgeB
MRSFEVPAIGACMLVEDTEEHREIFGEPGRVVAYFRAVDELVQMARRLRDEPAERTRLAREAHQLIVGGPNTYRDRLLAMLEPTAAALMVGSGLS